MEGRRQPDGSDDSPVPARETTLPIALAREPHTLAHSHAHDPESSLQDPPPATTTRPLDAGGIATVSWRCHGVITARSRCDHGVITRGHGVITV